MNVLFQPMFVFSEILRLFETIICHTANCINIYRKEETRSLKVQIYLLLLNKTNILNENNSSTPRPLFLSNSNETTLDKGFSKSALDEFLDDILEQNIRDSFTKTSCFILFNNIESINTYEKGRIDLFICLKICFNILILIICLFQFLLADISGSFPVSYRSIDVRFYLLFATSSIQDILAYCIF